MANTKVPIELSSTPGIVDNSNATAITIDASENVGIGTDSPSRALSVYGAAAGVIAITSNSTDGISSLSFGDTADDNAGRVNYLNASDDMLFYTATAERMRITSTGNVGIGVTSPLQALHVNSGTANNAAIFESTDAYTQIWIKDSTSSSTYQTGIGCLGDNLLFNNGSERMRIDASGNLMVGTTTSGGKVSIANNLTTNQKCLTLNGNTAGDSGYSAMTVVKVDAANTTSQYFIDFVISNGAQASGRITANGSGAATFSSWSDVTLKENIVDLPDQYDNIRALRPVEFDYIESEGGGHQAGFIAQEMREIYPCCVGEDSETGKLTIGGWSKTEARLVSALQSAMNKIEALTARIEALEGA